MNQREVGGQYEQKAVDYLRQLGYLILERNYNLRTGEIDVVAKDGQYYVFVEVKYRSNGKNGLPEEAIDVRKQRKITNTARGYLYKHRLSEDTPCRFDVVTILRDEIHLIQDAFDAMI